MKNYILIIGLIISQFLSAQVKNKGVEIINQLSESYQKHPAMSFDFAFKMDNAQEKISEQSKGQAWVKGDKYKVDLMGAETYFDGKQLWTYLKEVKEVNLSVPDPEDKNTFNPSQLFNSYQEGYKVVYKKEMFQHNRALQIIYLYPTKVKESEFHRVELKVDKDKHQIYQIIRYGKDGNDYTITISKMKPEKQIADSFFKFDSQKHPDVEIIDLR